MTDLEYLNYADALLLGIEQSCDRINDETDTDLDAQRVGGMVTIVFENQTQIIINQQKPLHEIWMAAKAGGFHFKWVDGHWQDTKGMGEFFTLLNQFASQQSGQSLHFSL